MARWTGTWLSGPEATPRRPPESVLDGQEVAIAFKPREEWPKSFMFLRPDR